MKLPSRLVLAALAVPVLGALGPAQIERLTLDQMVEKTDDAVVGHIVGQRVFRVDHPVDGPELYFTTLTISGRSLVGGDELTVDVTFHGGFVDPENGVHNSEAPSADDTKLGNRVVAFYKFTQNMGGDVAANALYAAHGGLYRTVEGPRGSVVLGRGDGYAVASNLKLDALDSAITTIRQRIEKR